MQVQAVTSNQASATHSSFRPKTSGRPRFLTTNSRQMLPTRSRSHPKFSDRTWCKAAASS
jgi:hypothetical protein